MAESQPPTVTARIASELIESAHVICAHTKGANNRTLKLTALLDALLRPTITAVREEVMRRVTEDHKATLTLNEVLEIAAQRMAKEHGGKHGRHRKASD